MNQKVLCHFELLVNEKYYQFSFQPGVVNFDDIENAFEAFKAELAVLKEKAVEAQQAEADAKAASEQVAPAEPLVAEAEPVAPEAVS